MLSARTCAFPAARSYCKSAKLRYNALMRLCAIWLAILSLAAFGQTSPPSAIEMKACSQSHTAKACGVAQKDLKNAQQDFRAGMRLRDSGDLEKAFDAVAAAARLVPNDLEYVTVREVLRQQLVLQHLKTGNNLVLADKADKATAEFRQALALDPSNEFARQRLSQTMPPILGNISNIAYADDDSELRLHPASGEHSYHYRGDTKGLFQAIGHDFGIAVEFDDSVSSRELRFYAGDLNFWRAVATASEMTCAGCFGVPCWSFQASAPAT